MGNAAIGMRIQKLRNVANYNQSEFARLIGTAQSTLSEIENGTVSLTIPLLGNISSVLNVPVDEIMSEQDHKYLMRTLIAYLHRVKTERGQKALTEVLKILNKKQ